MNKTAQILLILIFSSIILMLIVLNTSFNNYKKKEFYYQKLDWFKKYIIEMQEIISKLPMEVIITGSGALSLFLYKLEMFDRMKEMNPPNDLDLIYIGKGSDFFTRNTIDNFQRTQTSPGRSVSFILKNGADDPIIKSFDLTMVNSMDSIEIDGFKVITPQKLLYFYQDEDDPKLIHKNKNKITDLDKIIQKINESPNLKYKFFSDRERKRMRDVIDEQVVNKLHFKYPKV